MPPKKIKLAGGRGVNLSTENEYNHWLKIKGVEILIDEDNYEVGGFESLVDGGTYTLGPLQAEVRPRPTWELTEETDGLNRVEHQPFVGEPAQLRGRKQACDSVDLVVVGNCINRSTTDHGAFSFLTAAGHVRSGKTRMGIETPRLVEEVCGADENLRQLQVLPPLYLKIDFLNGCKYDAAFDVANVPPSVLLGARLMYAFYGNAPGLGPGRVLKDIGHEEALAHILEKMLVDKENEDIQPIVCHFDEYGAFTQQAGKARFVEMLRAIGQAVTSASSRLRRDDLAGRFFIVPITTGTSKEDTNIDQVSNYGVEPIVLPALSMQDTTALAKDFFQIALMNERSIRRELARSCLQVALADTAGLPGLIGMVCGNGVRPAGDYSAFLQNKLTHYTATSTRDWDKWWPVLSRLFLARPHVNEASIIYKGYTVANARDSGTILFSNNEIGVAPALFRQFNMNHSIASPLLLKHISNEEAWTWEDFEKAHALYLCAVICALIQEKTRFHAMTLGTLLRNAKPQDSVHLPRLLDLPTAFDRLNLHHADKQSIPKVSKSKRQKLTHTVDLSTVQRVILACSGTPIIDAHLNLKLSKDQSTESLDDVVLFIQYKHKKLNSRTVVHVSQMNAAVVLLEERLKQCSWGMREWLFLWVSNREIQSDDDPHPRLLWVGKEELVNHAPLIGRRGLVPTEMDREESDEEEDDIDPMET